MQSFRRTEEVARQARSFPQKHDGTDGYICFNHITHEGISHNFINSTALNQDWHFVHAIDQPINLTVCRLSDGLIHVRTLGFSKMTCADMGCPNPKSDSEAIASILDTRAAVYDLVHFELRLDLFSLDIWTAVSYLHLLVL